VTVGEASFPVGFTMGTVSSSQGSCAAFPCNLGTIANGGSATISVDYTVPSSTLGLQTNTVSVAVDGTNTGDHRRLRRHDRDRLVRPDRHQTDGETSVTAGDGVTPP